MKIRTHRIRAFSMVELSMIILVIAVVAAGAISISKSTKQTSSSATDIDKIQTIYKAITNFVALNKRLPCPATLTLTKGNASYGNEAANPGTCTETSQVVVSGSAQIVYGMVPFKVLGISQDIAEDAYGTRFSYVVDRRFTKKSSDVSATDGFEIIQGTSSPDIAQTVNIINVQGATGITNALFVVIGHGPNKSGGWPAESATQNNGGTTDENSNRGRSTSASGIVHDSTFVASSNDVGFDDVLLFKSKSQIIRDSGLEYIMCSGNEGAPASPGSCSSYSWSTPGVNNGNYGDLVLSNTTTVNCCQRKCGKYGAWETNPITKTGGCGCDVATNQIIGNNQYTGTSTHIAQGSAITVSCASGYIQGSGTPAFFCNANRTLSVQNNCIQGCALTAGQTFNGNMLRFDYANQNIAVGDDVQLSCNYYAGYTTVGSVPTGTCQSNGTLGGFTNTGNCKIGCSNSNGMNMGNNTKSASTGSFYYHNQDIVLNCQSGTYYGSGCYAGWCNNGRAYCNNGSWVKNNNYTCYCNQSGYSTTVKKCCHDSNHSCPDCCASQTINAANYNAGTTVCFSGDGGGCSSGFHKNRSCRTLNSKSCASASWSGESWQDY